VEIQKNDKCRICRNDKLEKVLSLGEMPPANNFLEKDVLESGVEKSYPLELYFCKDCGLAQLIDIVDPEILFRNYLYTSSTQSTLPKHFVDFANGAIKKFKLNNESLVIDIGSNDGTLLSAFRHMGINVLGIDPALNVSQEAVERGVDTICEFFGKETAQRIASIRGKADLIIANNVFAHINDIHDTVEGMTAIMKDHGVISVEVPYVVDMLEQTAYDTIYHEHLSYFSVSSLWNLFKGHGMEIFNVEKIETHGGSLRLSIGKKDVHPVSQIVSNFLNLEDERKVNKIETYRIFANNVQKSKENLSKLIKKLKSEGKKIAGYSAPAKSSTIINYCGMNSGDIIFIADKSPYKQSKFSPGAHIPITEPDSIMKEKPDYVIIFAWNVADEIIRQLYSYRSTGGKFIIPGMEPRIVE